MHKKMIDTITFKLKTIFSRFTAIYNLLGNLKKMFWITIVLMLLAVIWELVILGTVATFFQSLIDTTSYATSSFAEGSLMEGVYAQFNKIPEEYRLVAGFLFTALTVLLGKLINWGLLIVKTGFSTRFIINVRCQVFNQLYRCSLSYFDNQKKGALITMVVTETRSVYSVLKQALDLILASLRFFAILFALLYISIELTVIVIVLCGLFALEIDYVSRLLKKLSVVVVAKTRAMTVNADESLQGVALVKLFNLHQKMEYDFRQNCKDADFTNRKQGILVGFQEVVKELFLLLIVTVLLFSNMVFSFVTLALFLTYLFALRNLMTFLQAMNKAYGSVFQEIPRADRVLDFFADREAVMEKGGGLQRESFLKSSLEFKKVSLMYKGNQGEKVYAIKNLNFSIARGQSVALVGESGSGKTSLVNLLVRFYDPVDGEILVDETNIKEFDLTYLRGQIGLVNQDAVLFNLSIRDNILLGKENATEDELITAAKRAYVHEFVQNLPEGYDTLVGDRGVKLSGGQRQRINIAQVFLKKAEILIFDEATSALDSKSEQYIQKSIQEISKNCTTIIIAHRLSTVKSVDKVIVLDKGAIVEEGDWSTLIDKKGLFFDMVQKQLFIN